MAVSAGFKAFVLEQMGALLSVTARPMFGGLTLFHDGRSFALIDEDRLYLKVDAQTRETFVAAGLHPFLPFGDPERPMAYFEAPAEALDDSDQLKAWLELALDAARRAPQRSRKPRK